MTPDSGKLITNLNLYFSDFFVLVILSPNVERFGVFCMQVFVICMNLFGSFLNIYFVVSSLYLAIIQKKRRRKNIPRFFYIIIYFMGYGQGRGRKV